MFEDNSLISFKETSVYHEDFSKNYEKISQLVTNQKIACYDTSKKRKRGDFK